MGKSLAWGARHKQSPSKLIIRHLPPNLTEDVFKETLDLPTDSNSHWYLAGPVSADLGYFATSRAYVTFTRTDDLILFKEKYDGYVFVDTKGGGEYRAQVDLAPFQESPKSKKVPRNDRKVATLDKDPDYLKFVESLSASKSDSNVNAAELNLKELETRDRELKLSNGCPKITTPLIEFVLKKKGDRSRKKGDENRLQEDRNRRGNNRRHQSKNERTKGHKKTTNVQNENSEKKSIRESAGNNKMKGNASGTGGGQSKARDSKDRPRILKKSNEQMQDAAVVILKKPPPQPPAESSVVAPKNGTNNADGKPREARKRRVRGSKSHKKANASPKAKDGGSSDNFGQTS